MKFILIDLFMTWATKLSGTDWFLPAQRYASAVFMVLCLSVTSRCSIKKAERKELAFGAEASLSLSCIVLKQSLGISKKYRYFLLELFPKV